MRFLVAFMTLCFGATVGYADEPTETPEEIVISGEITDEEENKEVAQVGIDEQKSSKPRGGCNCGGKGK